MWFGLTICSTRARLQERGLLRSAPAHAQCDERVADYRNTVLTAFQEVEDNLAALGRLEEESDTEAAATTGAQLSKLGILNRRMSASVLLIRALGP